MKIKTFLASALKFCAASIVSALIGFLVIPIISRSYPTEEYGKINMFYSMGSLIMGLIPLGFDNAYIRFFNEPHHKFSTKHVYGLSFLISIITGIFSCLLLVLFFPQATTKYLFDENGKYWLILLLFIYAEAQVVIRLQSLASRLQMNALAYNTKQILLLLSTRLSFVFSLLYSKSYIPAVSIMTICTVLSALGISLKERNLMSLHFPEGSRHQIKELVRFALPTMPAAAINYLNNSIAKLTLSGYGDFESIGILSIATTLSNVFSLIPSAFAVYWSAFMYKNYDTEQKLIKKIHNGITLLSIILVCGIFAFQDILYMIVGEKYQSSQPYFMLIMLMPIQSLILETTGYGIMLAKKTEYSFYTSAGTCMINFIISLSLVPHLGALGAALGVAISSIAGLIIKTVLGQKYYCSITSAAKTFFGCLLLVTLCVINIFVYNHLLLRIQLVCGALLAAFFIYRKELSVDYWKN